MQDKNEILAKIDGLEALFLDKFTRNTEDHDKILEQTTKTNGRVNRLESWRDKVIGALIIMNVLLLPLAIMYIQKELQ